MRRDAPIFAAASDNLWGRQPVDDTGCQLCGWRAALWAQTGEEGVSRAQIAGSVAMAWAARGSMLLPHPIGNDDNLLWATHVRRREVKRRAAAACVMHEVAGRRWVEMCPGRRFGGDSGE